MLDTLTLNTNGVPGSTLAGPSMSSIPHVTRIWARTADANVSMKKIKRI
jgi:hypothetical protein